LESKGILDKNTMQLIREYHGSYRPFRPDTPSDAIILHVRGGFLDLDTVNFRKRDLTRNPKQ